MIWDLVIGFWSLLFAYLDFHFALGYFADRNAMRRFILIAYSLLLATVALSRPLPQGTIQIGKPLLRPGGGQRMESTGAVEEVVRLTEQGIINNALTQFQAYFAPQIYLHVRDEEEGYFSANQASLILQRFFSTGRIINFHFSTTQTRKTDAFATGGGSMMVQGTPRLFQVYIALSHKNGGWVLSQFSIY